MKTRFYLLTIALCSVLSSTHLVAATMHVILYAEENANENIYKSCQESIRLYRAEMQNVGHYTGMAVKFYRTVYTKENVNEVINRLSCSVDDVIFFAYVGHGYNWPGSDYPSLSFDNPVGAPHLKIERIHASLKNKGARLVITIGDACNKSVGRAYGRLIHEGQSRLQYTKLYLRSKGSILMASSKKGQSAWSYTNGKGSFFTLDFLEAIHQAIMANNASWKSVFEDTRNRVLIRSKREDEDALQEPVAVISIQQVKRNNTFRKLD